MSNDQSDVPTVCIATAIERKHERQMARRRERAIAEIQNDIDAEANLHKENIKREDERHRKAFDALLKEIQELG